MAPTLQSLILADHVYRDAATGKFVIAGTFNRLRYRATPEQMQKASNDSADTPGSHPASKSHRIKDLARAGSPWVYFAVRDVVGEVECSIRYITLRDHSVLLSTDLRITSDDRLKTHESALMLPPLPTPHEGIYLIEFLVGDVELGSVRVHAELQ